MRRQNLTKGEKDLENGKIKGKSDLAKAKEQLEVSQQTLTNGEAVNLRRHSRVIRC